MSNASTNYNSLDKALQADIAYASEHSKTLNTEYSAEAVHEYSVTPTTFSAPSEAAPSGDMPFDNTDDSSSPWS